MDAATETSMLLFTSVTEIAEVLLSVEPETLAVDLLAIETEEVDTSVVALIVTLMAVEASGKKSRRMI